jgi:hypothetical protein
LCFRDKLARAEETKATAGNDTGATSQGATVPRLVAFSGVLKDTLGAPLTGVQGVTFALYKEQSSGAALWIETQNVAADAEGRFTALLGATSPEGLPLDLFSTGQAQWLGIQTAGQPEQPRAFLTSVPYALALPSTLSSNGNIAGSSKLSSPDTRAVPGDPPTPPRPIATIVTAPGSGLQNSNDGAGTVTLSLITTCSNGQILKWTSGTPGSWACAADSGGGGGISGLGTAGMLPKFTGATTLGDSQISDDGTNVTIGVAGGGLNVLGNATSPNIIGGSSGNSVTAGVFGATIGGGGQSGSPNRVTDNFGTVSGGNNNTASGSGATVSGGAANTASEFIATVGGGELNSASGSGATVGGGELNNASGSGATVGGGELNNASGTDATIPGGFLNAADGDYSFAAGRGARAINHGAFVWADHSTDAEFLSTGNNQFLIRAGGGVGINTNSPTQALDVNGNMKALGLVIPTGAGAGKVLTSDASGNGTWQTPSGGGGGGDITAVNTPAGGGLTGGVLSGDANLSLLTTCSSGQLLKWNGISWGCAADDIGGGGGGISGSGTLNFVPKFTPDGATVGDSQISDDGTLVTIDNNLRVSGNLALSFTGGSSTGVVTVSGTRFLHTFGANIGAFDNTFLGLGAGNFTMAQDGGNIPDANTAVGAGALAANTTGKTNTAVGVWALIKNTMGNRNTAAGFQALLSNQTGSSNTAMGLGALGVNTTADFNTAMGDGALGLNETGSSNTAMGVNTLFKNTSSFNTAVGQGALFNNTDGGTNTAVGQGALNPNTTGSGNTAVGANAGGIPPNANTTGSGNTFIGSGAGPGTSTQLENATAIGADALVSISNAVVLGPASSLIKVGMGTSSPVEKLQVVGDIRVGTSGTNGCVKGFDGTAIAGICSSDLRLKTNIQPFGPLLNKLAQLQPVSFNWRVEQFPEYHFGPSRASGLIAQEVEKVFPEMVSTDERGYKVVNYSELPYLLLQAVRELKEEKDKLQDQIKAQQALLIEALQEQKTQIRQLQSEVAGLKKAVTSDEWRVTSKSEPRPGGSGGSWKAQHAFYAVGSLLRIELCTAKSPQGIYTSSRGQRPRKWALEQSDPFRVGPELHTVPGALPPAIHVLPFQGNEGR